MWILFFQEILFTVIFFLFKFCDKGHLFCQYLPTFQNLICHLIYSLNSKDACFCKKECDKFCNTFSEVIKSTVKHRFFLLLIVIVKSCGNFPKIFVVVMRRDGSFSFKVVDKSTTLKLISRFLANFGWKGFKWEC